MYSDWAKRWTQIPDQCKEKLSNNYLKIEGVGSQGSHYKKCVSRGSMFVERIASLGRKSGNRECRLKKRVSVFGIVQSVRVKAEYDGFHLPNVQRPYLQGPKVEGVLDIVNVIHFFYRQG